MSKLILASMSSRRSFFFTETSLKMWASTNQCKLSPIKICFFFSLKFMGYKTGLCEAVETLQYVRGKGSLGDTKRRAKEQNTRLIGVCNGTEISAKPLMMLRPTHPLSFSSLQLSNTFPFLWYKGESFILREVQTGSKGGYSVVLLPLLSGNSLPARRTENRMRFRNALKRQLEIAEGREKQ